MVIEFRRRVVTVVAQYPKLCIALSLLFAFLSSLSLLHCTIEDDIRRSFSPPNSRSSREQTIYAEFFNFTVLPERALIFFRAKDGGTMLRPAYVDEIYRIGGMFRAETMKNDSRVPNICTPLCDLNAAFDAFWVAFSMVNNGSASEDLANNVLFDYPNFKIHGYDVFIGLNIQGVITSEKPFAGNRSKIVYAPTVAFWYHWQTENLTLKKEVAQKALDMYEMSKLHNASALVNFDIFTDEIGNAEMIAGSSEATVLMAIGFFLLLGFVFAVVKRKVGIRALPAVVFATLFSPCLAALTAFGISCWLNYPIYLMMCITPFLILGIGVDDAFIMIQSWVHFQNIPKNEDRLSRVVFEIGPSVSITSITNAIAFGIGYLTPTPEMSTFCLCTSLACIVDYLLTFTFLAPVLVLCTGKAAEYDKAVEKYTPLARKPKRDTYGRYAAFLCTLKCRILLAAFLIILYTVSGYGALTMKATFDERKVFPSTSHLAKALQTISNAFIESFPLLLIVSNPPNISNPVEYKKFYEMVSALEHQPQSYGRDRTQLFLKGYEEFDRRTFGIYQTTHHMLFGLNSSLEYEPSYDNLPTFLGYLPTNPLVRMKTDKNGQPWPSGFQMTIMAHDISEWYQRAVFVDQCRTVLEEYPQFNVSIADFDTPILDLILTVKSNMLTSIAVTLGCMAAVCSMFVTDRIGLVIIVFNISSLCFTIIGGLSWWGAELDPITMIDFLIAAGFSVDYTAHIAHKFYKGKGSPSQRLAKSFSEMSAPMLQAGISTALVMLPVIFVKTYAVLALAKTIFLVVGLGLLHGLFILPILLALFSNKTLNVPILMEVAAEKSEGKNGPLLL